VRRPLGGNVSVRAVLMARDEADVIAYTIEHLLAEGVDRIVVADNRSADATRSILDTYAGCAPVTVIDDPVPAYYQAAKMSALAARGATAGDWVLPVDADELWHCLDGEPLAERLRALDADVVTAAPLVHVPRPDDDQGDPNPFTRTSHVAVSSDQMTKVAFRWRPGVELAMGNHSVFGAGHRTAGGVLGVRHFQWRSLSQVRRKVSDGVAALDEAGAGPFTGTHWRALAAADDAGLERWWDDYRSQAVRLDPAPWRGR